MSFTELNITYQEGDERSWEDLECKGGVGIQNDNVPILRAYLNFFFDKLEQKVRQLLFGRLFICFNNNS